MSDKKIEVYIDGTRLEISKGLLGFCVSGESALAVRIDIGSDHFLLIGSDCLSIKKLGSKKIEIEQVGDEIKLR